MMYRVAASAGYSWINPVTDTAFLYDALTADYLWLPGVALGGPFINDNN